MKILNPYRFIKGAGGKDAPTPTLTPPSNQNLRKSISVMQNIDILCEGPIYGLVDQFGKKVYGLDMLKGVYLNKTPVMNNKGEYNFRNILMEINLGTETQTPLPNFKNVEIFKPINFKLLGPIKGGETDTRESPDGKSARDFTTWARIIGDWPSEDKDPFIYVHKIRNKDVSKLKISLIVEALMDTVDKGTGSGTSADMGMSRSTSVELLLKYGLEGSNTYQAKPVVISGTIQSPFAYMIGDGEAEISGPVSTVAPVLKSAGGVKQQTSTTPNPTNAVSGDGYSKDEGEISNQEPE